MGNFLLRLKIKDNEDSKMFMVPTKGVRSHHVSMVADSEASCQSNVKASESRGNSQQTAERNADTSFLRVVRSGVHYTSVPIQELE
jgi:hypothetical protein